MNVLGFYVMTDGTKTQKTIDVAVMGMAAVNNSFRESLLQGEFNGEVSIADSVDLKKFPSREAAMYAFIQQVGGGGHITDDNSVIFVTDKTSFKPHLLVVCVIFEGMVDNLSSAYSFFAKNAADAGQVKLPGKVTKVLTKGEKIYEKKGADSAIEFYEEKWRKIKHPAICTRLVNSILMYGNDPIRCIDILDEALRDDPTLINSAEHVELFAKSLYACLEAGLQSQVSGLNGSNGSRPEDYILTIVQTARVLGSPFKKLAYIEEGLNKRKVKESSFFKHK